MKKLLSLLLLVSISLVGCSSNQTSSVMDSGVIVVGSECDYAPFNWTTSEKNKSAYAQPIQEQNGYCDGFDIRIAGMVAEDLGLEIKVKKIVWDGLIPALNSGTIDIIIAGMNPTEERKESISFTDPYFISEPIMAVIVKKDSEFAKAASLADLDGGKFTAQIGTSQIKLLEQIPNLSKTNPLPDYPSLMKATTSGVIDGYLAEEPVAIEHVKSDKSLTMVVFKENKGFEFPEEFVATSIGVRKDDTVLMEKINASLSKISVEKRKSMMNEFIKRSESE